MSAAESNPVHDEHATHDTERPTPLLKFQIFIIFLIQFADRTYYWFGHLSVRQSVRQRDWYHKRGRTYDWVLRRHYSALIPQELYSYTYHLPRNLLFFSQRLLLSFNGVIYQTGLDVDLFYFWLHLVWRLQCLSSVLRLHLFPLFFRDFFRVCSTATSVCKIA
jgi:hypothetical protein